MNYAIIGSEGEMEKARALYISTERTNYIVSSYIIYVTILCF